MRNRHRWLVFFLFLVIVPGVVALLFGLVLEPLIVKGLVLPGTLIGIPFLVWLAEAVATYGYWRLKHHLRAATS